MTPVGQPAVVVAVAVPMTSATLPSVELMLSEVLLASSAGKATPLVVPPDSFTKKYCPGIKVPPVSAMKLLAVPEKLPPADAD